ncbi:MAG: UDP-N-acetylmuramoyl-tripeptide--D-alanyl-D-alanine ligase [Bacteroidota bacterium]
MTTTEQLYKIFLESSGISTDTRKIQKGDIFFALKGDNFDGNKFAKNALDSGAGYAVIDNPEVATGDQYLLVDDVLGALQNLASYHRDALGIPIIGITGSNGKTTTKELLKTVLATRYRVSATEGNLNNHIGVPLTLLKMDENTEVGIVEMGANHVGEIAALCNIAHPSHGIITNIGKAHLEGFGGFEGVLRAKSELYHHLIEHGGTIFVNSDDDILMNMTKRMKHPILYNNQGDFYESKFISVDPFVKYQDSNGSVISTQLIGKYNFKNLAAALCIGKYFQVDSVRANDAVSEYKPANNRSQIIETKSNKIILDAYNANPVSMKAALDNLDTMDHPKKVVILGDMFELGADTQVEHKSVVEQTDNMDLNQAIFCGEASASASGNSEKRMSFKSKDKLVEHLSKHPIKDALVLIKASRGMGLEILADLL